MAVSTVKRWFGGRGADAGTQTGTRAGADGYDGGENVGAGERGARLARSAHDARSDARSHVPDADDAEPAGGHLDDDGHDALLRSLPPIGEDGEFSSPERQSQASLIAKLGSDLQEFERSISENEFHLRHIREKLNGFAAFVDHADVEFDEIHRLRRQKAQLSADLAAEETLNQEMQRALEIERANVMAVRERMNEYRAVLEGARKEIVTLVERDRKHRERIDELTDAVARRENKLRELADGFERLAAESQVLKDGNERLNANLGKYKDSATALAKKVDELIEKGVQAQDEIDRLSANLTVANEALDTAQTENVQLQSRFDNALAEKKALERRVNDKVRIREEELFSLRSRIEGLQSELKIKDQLLAQASDEAKQARNGQEAAESAVKGLTEQLAREVRQREEYRDRLNQGNSDIAEVNERFKRLIEELEQARRENVLLQRMLKAERQKVELAVSSVPGAQLSRQEQQKLLDGLSDTDEIKPN